MLLNNMDLRNFRYGLIGTDDWSMFPMIPPGSLVVIDDTRRRIATSGWTTRVRPAHLFSGTSRRLCVRMVHLARRPTDRAAPSRLAMRCRILRLSR